LLASKPLAVDEVENMTYRLQFPFQPQNAIDGIDQPVRFQIGDQQARLFSRSKYVVLELGGFSTPEQASAHTPIVWAALRWVLIDRGINTIFDLQPNDIVWAEDSIQAAKNMSENWDVPNNGPIHGIAGSDGSPIVFRDDQNIRFFSASACMHSITPLQLFLPLLTDALSRPGTDRLIENPRFRLAADLYSSYYLENSPSSRLVTLGMALEVIADPADKHQAALQLIERWRDDIERQKSAVAADQDAVASLESLRRELLIRKQASIRSRIRSTANRLACHLVAEEQQGFTKNAVDIYDARSSLVHNGQSNDNNIYELVEKGRKTVSLLLKAYYYDILRSDG
jgi:hypothetical protein